MSIRATLPPARPTAPPTGLAAAARSVGNRLAAVLRPIRVLEAVRWPQEVETAFIADGGKELPAITAETYRSRALPFNPADTRTELHRIERDTHQQLGSDHPCARLLLRATREAELTVHLIEARGTPAFPVLSRELYGTTRNADWPQELAAHLGKLHDTLPLTPPARTISASAAASELASRFAGYFTAGVRVSLCDELSADAAAGNGYLKLRAGATFSTADVRMLEVHEGWAHLGTTLNARLQSTLPVLGWCSPSATRTQEGLAVFLELATGAASRQRVQKILNRVRAVSMAEAGADFRDVFRFFRESTDNPSESFRQAARVFRGSVPAGGPFTKDACYGEGLIRVLHFVRGELARGGWGRVPLLMCGKTAVEDAGLLTELGCAGLLAPPCWMPPTFRDRSALQVWMDAMA